MGTINLDRVFLGGVVAGVIYCLLELPLMFFVGDDVLKALNGEGMSPRLVAIALSANILLAITILWVYAAIRPRFGPGPKTAVIAVVIIWWTIFLVDMFLIAAGLGQLGPFLLLFLYTLVASVLATPVGAWLYQEESG